MAMKATAFAAGPLASLATKTSWIKHCMALVLVAALAACGGGSKGASGSFGVNAPTAVTATSQASAKDSAAAAEVEVEGTTARVVVKELAFAQKTASSARTPIYRFFNTQTNTHFYTSSATERDSACRLSQYQLDGVGFYAYADAQPGMSAVYRFYNLKTGTHFYTISASERDTVRATMSATFTYEGPAWYAATAPDSGNTPIYRFYNATTGAHFYTVSAQERAIVAQEYRQYAYEGVGYFAWPTQSAADDTPAQPDVPVQPVSPSLPGDPSQGGTGTGGGQGGTGGSMTGGDNGQARTLFAAAISVGVIASFSDPNPAPGTALAGRTITGIGALGKSLAYDAASDRLYATNASSIIVIDQASKAAGAVAPSRTISVPAASFIGWTNLYFDKAADVLYLCGSQQYNPAVAVIPQASTANGAVTSARVFRLNSGSSACVVDPQRHLLYALGSTIGVYVFDMATLSDTLPSNQNNQAARVLNFPGFIVGTGLAIDVARDRLYASDLQNKLVIVNDASTASGQVIYSKIALPAPSEFVTLDAAHDRLYVGSYPNAAFVFNNASTLGNNSTAVGTAGYGASSTASTIAGFAFP
jgi:hypothetical protein